MPLANIRLPERTAISCVSTLLGALPPNAISGRVANAYLGRRQLATGQYIETRLSDGTRFALDIGDRTQAFALLTRRYSPEVTEFVLSGLPPGGTFVDVGANVGLISLPVAHQRPDANVVAFEPHPTNVGLWRRNHELNDLPNARLEPLALSDHEGGGTMTLDSDLGSGYVTDGGEIAMEMTTLDAFAERNGIDDIAVLKVDVEGNEPRVLDGAAQLLAAGRIQRVIVEINVPALERSGFDEAAVTDRLTGHGLVAAVVPGRAQESRELYDLAFIRP